MRQVFWLFVKQQVRSLKLSHFVKGKHIMYQFILLIHVFAAALIVALVLLQQGKGSAMGAAFGSGASQTVFGSRGSGSFLFRVTMSLIVIFFVTSISLNYLATHAYKQEKAAAAIPLQQSSVPAAKMPDIPAPSSVGRLPSLPVEGTKAPVNDIPVRK